MIPELTNTETEVIDLGKAQDGARIAGALPYIKDEVEGLERRLITQTLTSLQKRELTPEAALQSWIELAAYRALIKRMTMKTMVGVTASERQAQILQLK